MRLLPRLLLALAVTTLVSATPVPARNAGFGPMTGLWSITLTAKDNPWDGGKVTTEKSKGVIVEIADATGTGPSTVSIGEFAVLEETTGPVFFPPMSGPRYGKQFRLLGENGEVLRGKAVINNIGLAVSFTATASTDDQFGIVDVVIKGKRIGF